jgi:hypothetical protein
MARGAGSGVLLNQMAVCQQISIVSRAALASPAQGVGGRRSIATGPARDKVTGTLQGWFGKWLESLRDTMGRLPARFPEDTAATAD